MTLFGPGDYAQVFTTVTYLLLVTGLLALFFRKAAIWRGSILTGAEIIVGMKLVGIVILTLLLVLVRNALELPEEMFIYGRF